ncbi:hypothetical protein SADUNF_Sadunf16G0247400 [Salix dunnii]|uniref:Uncharacterized protein n=1 Tax=Salix dunnii TaxID=1413687 RepID=A0A835J8K6_9ROSI|nr:hypothetical protein SADUNF_Sadunf16G0247400 [Salix dunnii]
MHSVFRTRTPLLKPRRQALLSLLDPSVIIHRTLISCSNKLESESQNDDQHGKSLHLSFQEAVGLCEKTGTTNLVTHEKTNGFEIKLLELEREARDLKEPESKKGREEKVKNVTSRATEEKPSKNLYSVFLGQSENKVEMKGREERPMVLKEERKMKLGREDRPRVFKGLSPDMEMFITHLYKEGYFSNASFLKDGSLDFGFFNDSYGRDFIKYAAEKFGKDHQEIAKWLSGSDLKRVALFGCPTLMRKSVFSAKRLRNFFEIQEAIVCNQCVLKHSCNFVNQSVWRGDTKTLNLAVVMRVITSYALEAVHPELSVPNEIKASVNRLLTEILNLSQTVRQAA